MKNYLICSFRNVRSFAMCEVSSYTIGRTKVQRRIKMDCCSNRAVILQSILDESKEMMEHPSKDARAFAESVRLFLLSSDAVLSEVRALLDMLNGEDVIIMQSTALRQGEFEELLQKVSEHFR